MGEKRKSKVSSTQNMFLANMHALLREGSDSGFSLFFSLWNVTEADEFSIRELIPYFECLYGLEEGAVRISKTSVVNNFNGGNETVLYFHLKENEHFQENF